MSINLEKECFIDESQIDGFECVVYWIRKKSMTCYVSDGYIGVSKNLKQRLLQHESACRCNTYRYHEDMKNCILKNNYHVDILYKGSRETCSAIEHLLRPKKDIGWNLRHGGEKVLTDFNFKVMKIFRNMKHQARRKNLKIYPTWEKTLGYFDFEEFYKNNSCCGSLEMKLPDVGEVNKESLIFVTRKDVVNITNRNIDFFGDGVLMSNGELSELLCIDKPNTLATQRRRGWSNGKIFMKAWENDKSR